MAVEILRDLKRWLVFTEHVSAALSTGFTMLGVHSFLTTIIYLSRSFISPAHMKNQLCA